MKLELSEHERSRLNEQIARAEKNTNTQIVLATVKRSDSYVEIPWIAFAFGISIAGFTVFLADLFIFKWILNSLVLISLATTLAAGIFIAFLTVLSPVIARIFLSKNRKEVETRQYAESLFLNRELFATTGRRGVLLLISLFERQIIILPDKGLKSYLTTAKLEELIKEMAPLLRVGNLAGSLEKGLSLLTAELPATAETAGNNELSNEIIEEEGV